MMPPDVPAPDAVCAGCGELLTEALRRVAPDTVLCRNCRDAGWHQCGTCALCRRAAVPIEVHHLAGWRHIPHLTLDVCLNCHAWLSQRQMAAWPTGWARSGDALAGLLLGSADALALLLLRRTGEAVQQQETDLLLQLALPGVLVAVIVVLATLVDRYLPGLRARERMVTWGEGWWWSLPAELSMLLDWREADA